MALDPVRARELTRKPAQDDLRTLIEVVLERFEAGELEPREVVLDVVDGRLQGLLTLARTGDDSDVIACTPEEGVALAVRAGLKLYASDEALALANSRPGPRDRRGPETVH